MSIGSRVLSSSHASLSDEQQSTLLFETYGQPQRRNRALIARPLYRDFNKPGSIKGLFGFHHFQPSLNSFFDIGNSFFISLPLRKTPWKRRNLCHIISTFVLFNYYMKFHIDSLLSKVLLKIYQITAFLSNVGNTHRLLAFKTNFQEVCYETQRY